MTPNDIEVLIHFCTSHAKHPREDAPAVIEAIDSFYENGLIEPCKERDSGYQATERGMLHLNQLCKVPWPRKAWVDANNNIISTD